MSYQKADEPRVPLEDLYTALSVVTGEVMHEVTHTLLFLRQFVNPAAAGVSLSQDAMVFAEQEIARLERLLVSLRMFKPSVPQKETLRILDVVQQALSSVSTTYRFLSAYEVDVPPDLKVLADEGMLLRALDNVLEYVSGSARPSETFGIRVVLGKNEPGSGVTLQIWHSGSADPRIDQKAIFLPWKQRDYDHPMRLPIAHRLFRGLGWSLTYNRTANHDEYSILIPAAAVVVPR